MKAQKLEEKEEAEKKAEAETSTVKEGQNQNQNQYQNNGSWSTGRPQAQTQTVPSGGIVYGTAHTNPGQQKGKAQTQRVPSGGIVWGPPQTYNPGQQKQNGNNNSNKNQGWTTEQDADLRRMKADNTSWKAIATELGKHVHEVKTRWGQVRPKDEGMDMGKQREREDKGKQRERDDKPEPKAIVEEPMKVGLLLSTSTNTNTDTDLKGTETVEKAERLRPRLHGGRPRPAQPAGGQVRRRQVAAGQLAVL